MFVYIIQQAVKLKASDIHFENYRDNTLVRLRVFGILYPIFELPHDKYRVLLSTVAKEADLSTSDKKSANRSNQQSISIKR